MFINTYICIYVCIYLYIYLYIYIHTHTHTCVYVYVHVRGDWKMVNWESDDIPVLLACMSIYMHIHALFIYICYV